MILDDLAADNTSDFRFNQILAGADALLSAPATSAALHPIGDDEPALALNVFALIPAEEEGKATPQIDLTSEATALANQAVLQTHALEGIADANGLIGTVHGVTNLGESAVLGPIGNGNLVTDIIATPAVLVLGNPSPLGHLVPDAMSVDGAANQLLSGVATDGGANPGLIAPASEIASATQFTSATPVETLANSGVLDFHDTLEGASDVGGLPGSVHGVTNLGETIGLGHLGAGDNLLTDVANIPLDLLSGNSGTLGNLPTDAINVVGAAGDLASGVESDVASGTFLANPFGNAINMAQALSTFPTASLANEAIDTIHASLEAAVDPLAPGTIHGVIGLGNAVGLGEIGGANALTDVTNAPGALLAGDTMPVTNLPGDIGTIGSAASAALTGAGSDLAQSGLIDAAAHPTTGSGLLPGDLPGQGIVDGVTSPVTNAIGAVGAITGTESTTQAATATLGIANAGLLESVLHGPGDVVDCTSDGIAPLPGEAGASLASANTIIAAAIDAVAHDSGSVWSGGELAPAAAAGAVAGGTLAGLEPVATSGAVSVSHDLASAAAGLVSSAIGDAGGAASDLVSGGAATAATATHDAAATADTLLPSAVTDASGTVADVATTAASAGDTLAHTVASTGAASAAGSTVSTALSDAATVPTAIVSASAGATHTAAHLVSGATDALMPANGAPAGSHDVATLSVGPQTATGGTSLDVLPSHDSGTQLAESHTGTVGAPTPTVASVSLLPDTLHFPAATGGGGDALSGAFSSVASSAVPVTSLHTGVDMIPAHADMPIAAAHADPLATLAHAVHHV